MLSIKHTSIYLGFLDKFFFQILLINYNMKVHKYIFIEKNMLVCLKQFYHLDKLHGLNIKYFYPFTEIRIRIVTLKKKLYSYKL